MKKRSYFFSTLLFFLCVYAHQAQLPYSKEVSSKIAVKENAVSKMVNDLGHTYFLATDSLFIKEFPKSKVFKELIYSVYLKSEDILYSISNEQHTSSKKETSISFENLRVHTLINLQKASAILIDEKAMSLSLDWNYFTKSVTIADAYCKEIILYRESIGFPVSSKKNKNTEKKISAQFEEKLGADGLTNSQWVKIMEGGGGIGAHDKIRSTNRKNQEIVVKLKKKERAFIKVGALEVVKPTSNVVDGLMYTYYNYPPKQISFSFSSDNSLIEELVNYIVYINSGNTVQLSEMFRVGLDIIVSDNNQFQIERYRDVIDKNENQVRLEFSEKYFDKAKFLDITMTKVAIKRNQIEFFGEFKTNEKLGQKNNLKVIILKNSKGNLLDRVKLNINRIREGLQKYNKDIMNLKMQ